MSHTLFSVLSLIKQERRSSLVSSLKRERRSSLVLFSAPLRRETTLRLSSKREKEKSLFSGRTQGQSHPYARHLVRRYCRAPKTVSCEQRESRGRRGELLSTIRNSRARFCTTICIARVVSLKASYFLFFVLFRATTIDII